MTLIVLYGVNEDAKDRFFEEVQEELYEGENLLVMGYLNGKVGNQNKGFERVVGREGQVVKNENGGRIIEVCVENGLVIENTKIKHKDINKFTTMEHSRN